MHLPQWHVDKDCSDHWSPSWLAKGHKAFVWLCQGRQGQEVLMLSQPLAVAPEPGPYASCARRRPGNLWMSEALKCHASRATHWSDTHLKGCF